MRCRVQLGINSTSDVLMFGNFAKIGRAISMTILNANIIISIPSFGKTLIV